MQSLNETWEDKMQRTQQVQKEREKALEELGITVERGDVGVHTPKRVGNIGRSVWVLLTSNLSRRHIWSIWYDEVTFASLHLI